MPNKIFRKKVSYQDAVSGFITVTIKQIDDDWWKISEAFEDAGIIPPNNFEEVHKLEFFLALCSLEVISIFSIYDKKQASLIYDLILYHVSNFADEAGSYSKETIRDIYVPAIDYCIKHNFSFMNEVSQTLLYKLEIKFDDLENQEYSLLKLTTISEILTNYYGKWVLINQKYKIKD